MRVAACAYFVQLQHDRKICGLVQRVPCPLDKLFSPQVRCGHAASTGKHLHEASGTHPVMICIMSRV